MICAGCRVRAEMCRQCVQPMPSMITKHQVQLHAVDARMDGLPACSERALGWAAAGFMSHEGQRVKEQTKQKAETATAAAKRLLPPGVDEVRVSTPFCFPVRNASSRHFQGLGGV